jgi:L-2-hydroxyglutarate oxidase LhgO
MYHIKTTIIGAGIVGLAIANELAKKGEPLFIIEKNASFGMETSSRNSEVVHAGIYYPTGSLKHRLCIEGNHLIYEICKKNEIQCKQTGKLIVAPKKADLDVLYDLFEHGKANEIPGLEIISGKKVSEYEPSISCREAIYSPVSGIVDSHSLMKYFLYNAKYKSADISYNTDVIGIEKLPGNGFIVKVREHDGSNFLYKSDMVINCAGLESDIIADLAGINLDDANYRLKYCKGSYLRVRNPGRFAINHLIYPTAPKHTLSLGIHVALELDGGVRLGPDVEYLFSKDKNYDVSEEKIQGYFNSVHSFIPSIEINDLHPDISGIRPKLQGPHDEYRDFVIANEKERGLDGFINLIGIDSPGLTSSPAIARYVKKLL